jgi:hypothetical protein
MHAIPLLLLFAGDAKPFELPAKESHYALVAFPAKHKAVLSVASEKKGDVDLFVIDALGKTIARDTTVGKDAKVTFITKDEQTVLVKIENLGPGANRCKLTHNGNAAMSKSDFKVAAAAKHAFFLQSASGNVASLRGNASISVYDVENNKIASQSGFVAWEVKKSKVVRVVATNSGKVEAVMTYRADDLTATPMPAIDLEHGAKKSFELRFPSESIAAVWVTSEKDTDVDVMVYDAKGKEVVSDITIGKDCFVGWLPAKDANYRVVVINHGAGANRCVLKHTGAK